LARMPWNQAGTENQQCDAGTIGLERKQA
jgi:hypothetical protein